MIKSVFIPAIILMIIGCIIALIISTIYFSEPKLNFHGHFKPKQHYFFEKCCKCGRRLKHYHWFWGKGDKMFCDVDYHGNTEWYCEECDNEIHKNTIHCNPNIYGG
jgi:hypothetical protein